MPNSIEVCMANCMSCGYGQNRTGAKHCSNCGARLNFLAPGEVLHQRYKIISLLGKGGMGAVCLVEDTEAKNKRCVVKELIDYFNPSDPDEVAKAKQRFEDEARTLAGLDHPSIPDVRGYFSDAGRNYMVMQFVEGENLQDWLLREGKALPHDEVLQYTIQVCRVLEYL
ncbi:MAG: protein kinase, partial [Anaerolineae bacterium]